MLNYIIIFKLWFFAQDNSISQTVVHKAKLISTHKGQSDTLKHLRITEYHLHSAAANFIPGHHQNRSAYPSKRWTLSEEVIYHYKNISKSKSNQNKDRVFFCFTNVYCKVFMSLIQILVYSAWMNVLYYCIVDVSHFDYRNWCSVFHSWTITFYYLFYMFMKSARMNYLDYSAFR